ncbi:MAG TPA: helix-turn-helix domain-containing protein [Sphingomicrobium sp.]|nr:helix-turn-helix domain-containing protein [Sphingomicrobium sp.]
MSPATVRHLEPLSNGHPCQGCEARSRAVCGVLDCESLAELKHLGRDVSLGPGQTLFYEGDRATRVFTLTRGSLKLYKLLADGRCHVMGFMHPGDFLGITLEDDHAFTAEALEQAQLCSFPRKAFEDFLDDHSSMERELYRMAAHELAAAQQQQLLLARKTAIERLASFLLVLGARRTGADKSTVVKLSMDRSDIADYLGLTKETVSRMFSAMRRDRLIRLLALDTVQILDRDRLMELAQSNS